MTRPLQFLLDDAKDWRSKVKHLFNQLHQIQYRYHDPEGKIEILSLRLTALRKTEVVALHAGKSRGSGAPPTRLPATGQGNSGWCL